METNIKYSVFEGEGFSVDETLLSKIEDKELKHLAREMMESGHYQDGIDVSKFLREDLTIALEKLALATTLAVGALESLAEDYDITLKLRGLDKYFELRGITGQENKEREERTFLLVFITAEAMEASVRDTLVVKFVQ